MENALCYSYVTRWKNSELQWNVCSWSFSKENWRKSRPSILFMRFSWIDIDSATSLHYYNIIIEGLSGADPGFWNGGWKYYKKSKIKINYFNIWGIRKKRKKGPQKKGGGGWKFTHFTSPGFVPVHSVVFISRIHFMKFLFLVEALLIILVTWSFRACFNWVHVLVKAFVIKVFVLFLCWT